MSNFMSNSDVTNCVVTSVTFWTGVGFDDIEADFTYDSASKTFSYICDHASPWTKVVKIKTENSM